MREQMDIERDQTKSETQRLWEVDVIRGIAVVLMVCYHFIFDLAYFGAYSGNMYSTFWQSIARSIGTTFILVMGVSLTLRYSRLKSRLDRKQLFLRYLRRGAILFGWGMVITAVTYFVVGHGFVVFGILHLLGASTVLAFPFLRSRWASLVGGIVAIGLGVYLGSVKTLSPWLLWLGVPEFRRWMVDYYPLFPWFGLALLGIFLGFTLYDGGARRFALPDLSQRTPVRALGYLGRHSLLIYLVHQPILFGILILAGIGSI
jgi:uncharacterized membrane protein